jgi:hypothetical protein
MSTIDSLAKHHYVATEAQVESLAREQYTAASQVAVANSTYLRVLIAGCQAELGQRRRGPVRVDAQLELLEKVHARFYAAVMRGVTTEDIAQDESLDRTERGRRQLERNRRSGFARSAATTLRNYVRAGGDLRALEVDSVSKSDLQKFVASQESPDTDKFGQRIARGEKTILNAIKQQARASPDKAVENLEALLERLQRALLELEPDKALVTRPPGDHVTARNHARTRVGVPVMKMPGRAQS